MEYFFGGVSLTKKLFHSSALGALDAVSRKEFWASLALKYTKGLGGRTYKKLLTSFGSAFEALQQVKEWKQLGIPRDKSLGILSDSWRAGAKKEWEAVRGCYGTILLWTDPRYPNLLKEISDPPLFLYCLGDISLLENPCIAIVGTRKCSIEGIRVTRAFAKGLATAGITVVSGMALGIDREAHLSSIDFPGKTIGVLGSGINISYPRQNNDVRELLVNKGLLISEYAPGTHPEPGFFPTRNRIISGLSLGVLIIEAALRSGSLITARLALEQNRSVYAIPGAIGSPFAEGCQDLIREGARPIFSVDDILHDLSESLKGFINQYNNQDIIYKEEKEGLEEQDIILSLPAFNDKTTLINKQSQYKTFGKIERQIIDIITLESKDIDQLCQLLQLPAEEISPILIMLEIEGIIKRLPNTQYVLA